MKLWKKILLGAALLLFAGGVAFAFLMQAPYKGFENATFVDFPRGTGTAEVARRLAAAGVIRAPWLLLAVRAVQPNLRLQAGEYRFEKAASVWEVADRLRRGDVYLMEVRIPEGYNLYEIADLVEKLQLTSADAFLKAARDPNLVRDLAPDAPTLEGFLFPSTYFVPRKTTAAALCRVLTEQFRKEWKALGGGKDALRTVTLASLVEKETGAPEERPMVAAVYRNRIEKGMKLEADPTTIYAARLSGAWRGTIYRSDLQRVHPYNTYAVPGLPPGPIANPGRAALEAALRPKDFDFIFFVARPDGSGRHTFSKTLTEHSRAVAAWRRGRSG